MKLLVEAFAGIEGGFRYRYHVDAHTSLIGIREAAIGGSVCVGGDGEMEKWIEEEEQEGGERVMLVGWPAQSNFNGRRTPTGWGGKIRSRKRNCYSLLDAAALLTTAQLDLSDPSTAPDFVALSFYKIFGFPDLGALIVRKEVAPILTHRRYFGGGTVNSLTATDTTFFALNTSTVHNFLEDGTLPFHSIIALSAALDTYTKLYISPQHVGRHTFALAQFADQRLRQLRHSNGRKLCHFYSTELKTPLTQGPILSFNMHRADGSWIGYAEVEKLFSEKKIHVRVGGMCNPGGVQKLVGLSAEEIKANFAAGHKCSDAFDVMHEKPTGAVRVSFGGMSALEDALMLLRTVEEVFVETEVVEANASDEVKKVDGRLTLCKLSNRMGEGHANKEVDPVKAVTAYSVSSMTPKVDSEVRPSAGRRLRTVLSNLRRGGLHMPRMTAKMRREPPGISA
jgi:molybdenum cofactor sulfurtransferase